MGAVEAIRKAGNRILFTVERKVIKMIHPKVYTLPISREGEEPRKPSPTPNPSSESTGKVESVAEDQSRGQSPSPHSVFPCPVPQKATSAFDAMIPSESKGSSAVVTVTVKHPDVISKPVPELFPPTPTDLGTVTEVITKSTLTETVYEFPFTLNPSLFPGHNSFRELSDMYLHYLFLRFMFR